MSLRSTLHLEKGGVLLLGNEAIARGALEGGVGVAAAYPGTPSSEIVEALMSIKDDLGIYVEWSVNEKVAFEVAYAAAISGIRSLVAMKHVGLNVAADPLMSSAYTGVEEGFVIVTADDPSMWSSQNEQDNRIYGMHAYIPVFEPYSPTEAKELTKELLNLSSKHKHPVILRTTTRISHARGIVNLGPIPKPKVKGSFNKELRSKYVLIPANARRNKVEMLRRFEEIRRDLENFRFNRVEGSGRKVIIASGLAYAYVKELIDEYGLSNTTLVKLTSVYPIPRKLITNTLANADEVLVVEELEPVVELQVKELVVDEGLRVKVHGKNLVGYPYELSLERVAKAISKFLGISLSMPEGVNIEVKLPVRRPTFCPGCPYRPLFYAVRSFINRKGIKVVTVGDIGCYSLGYNPPYNIQDILIEMGGSIGVGNGLAKVIDDIVISFIGDSTFFHAGIPALINAVVNRSPQVVVILDNEITAMTGHQPSPSTKAPGRTYISIEDLCKGLGIRFVKVVDPFKINEVMKVLDDAVNYVRSKGEVAVIISRRKCALQVVRELRSRGIRMPEIVINESRCRACGICYKLFSCPAIVPRADGKASIDPSLCIGCGACVEVCPFNAIEVTEPKRLAEMSSYWF